MKYLQCRKITILKFTDFLNVNKGKSSSANGRGDFQGISVVKEQTCHAERVSCL